MTQKENQKGKNYFTVFNQVISFLLSDFAHLESFLQAQKKNAHIYEIVHLLFLKHGTTFALELTPILAFYGLLIMVFQLSMGKLISLKILLQ